MSKNKKEHIFKISLSALFSALLAVCSWMSIPTPSGISFTLQTFAAALCGYSLGALWGLAAYGAYLLCGLLGFPVFSGFGAGIGQLFGVTGGYLIGFFALIALCGVGKRSGISAVRLGSGLLGMLLCHLIGALQLAYISGGGILSALAVACFPYLAKDVASVAAALLLYRALRIRGLDRLSNR